MDAYRPVHVQGTKPAVDLHHITAKDLAVSAGLGMLELTFKSLAALAYIILLPMKLVVGHVDLQSLVDD